MSIRRCGPLGFAYLSALVLAMGALPGCSGPGGGGGSSGGENGGQDSGNGGPDNEDGGQDNGNDNVSEPVEGLGLTQFSTATFSGSGNCTACHNGLADEGGNDVSIPDRWRATVLANAARDPLFLASVELEVARAPEGFRPVVEDICAKCHMPMARTQALADGTPTLMLNAGFLDPDHELHEAAMDGVSCTACHQIKDELLGQQDSFSGGYVINTDSVAPDRELFGPYPDPVSPDLMQGSVGYTPVEGEHLSDSGMCATCHTLFTPTLDAEGNIVGGFPEQMSYFEWQQSVFGDGAGDDDRSCQSCHMPLADGAVAISRVPPDLAARGTFRQHTFVGGNVFLLRLLRDNIEELGLTASSAAFDASIATTEAFLRNETADLSIVIAAVTGDTLTAALVVENLAGHKFPTGIPSRRAWIHLTVVDATGAVVFESGAPRDDGSIAGNAADADATLVEPHYRIVTSADQVQIYESIMENTDDEVTYGLLRADAYRKDNRLLPDGFDPGAADDATAVAGAAAEDDDFTGGSDRIDYEIDVAGAARPLTVSAELLFQSVSFRFARSVIEEPGSLTAKFGELYEAADKSPSVVATASATVD